MWPATTRELLTLVDEASKPDAVLSASLTGALSLAESPTAARGLAREARARVALGLRAEMWAPSQVAETTYGRLNVKGVAAALWLPDEGRIQPLTLLAHLARRARSAGVHCSGRRIGPRERATTAGWRHSLEVDDWRECVDHRAGSDCRCRADRATHRAHLRARASRRIARNLPALLGRRALHLHGLPPRRRIPDGERRSLRASWRLGARPGLPPAAGGRGAALAAGAGGTRAVARLGGGPRRRARHDPAPQSARRRRLRASPSRGWARWAFYLASSSASAREPQWRIQSDSLIHWLIRQRYDLSSGLATWRPGRRSRRERRRPVLRWCWHAPSVPSRHQAPR